jgi:hypothetical protein
MCLVTFGPISRVGSKNACGVARVVCQEPPEPCTTLKATWTLGVVTDHRQEGGGAQVERAKNTVLESKGLGVILSTSETRPPLENQHPTLWPGPATQPLAVGDVTGSGTMLRTEAPQALTWRGDPRRPRGSPAGTRHRRPSPHPTARAAPRALAHPGSARRDSPRGADERRRPARPAGPRADGGRWCTHPGGAAPPGRPTSTRRRGYGPLGQRRARLVPGPPSGPAPFPRDGFPLPLCYVLCAHSGSSWSTLAAIIACNGGGWRPPYRWTAQRAPGSVRGHGCGVWVCEGPRARLRLAPISLHERALSKGDLGSMYEHM